MKIYMIVLISIFVSCKRARFVCLHIQFPVFPAQTRRCVQVLWKFCRSVFVELSIRNSVNIIVIIRTLCQLSRRPSLSLVIKASAVHMHFGKFMKLIFLGESFMPTGELSNGPSTSEHNGEVHAKLSFSQLNVKFITRIVQCWFLP